jgi:hypothetical protein
MSGNGWQPMPIRYLLISGALEKMCTPTHLSVHTPTHLSLLLLLLRREPEAAPPNPAGGPSDVMTQQMMMQMQSPLMKWSFIPAIALFIANCIIYVQTDAKEKATPECFPLAVYVLYVTVFTAVGGSISFWIFSLPDRTTQLAVGLTWTNYYLALINMGCSIAAVVYLDRDDVGKKCEHTSIHLYNMALADAIIYMIGTVTTLCMFTCLAIVFYMAMQNAENQRNGGGGGAGLPTAIL